MKKLLTAGITAAALFGAPALAADLPTKAPAYRPAPAPMFSWTGFYIGGQVGYGWGDSFQCFSCGASVGGATDHYNISGAAGGGTVGYNWQLNPNWVAGVETDLSAANIKGTGHSSATFSCSNGVDDACNTNVDWFGTVRGRLGYAANNVLYYGTGGWAFGRIKADIDRCAGIATGDCGSAQANGWAFGGGIEYAFAGGWSAKIEYLRVELGKVVYSNATGSGCVGINCSADANFNVVRVGLNYKFGDWGKAPAVSAKY